MPDRLEYDLAHKFFPSVLLQWHSVDRSESYLYNHRSAPYTLRPYISSVGSLCNASFECLEIRWGIAFFYDHGDTTLGEHIGDSEMYAALLRRKTTWTIYCAESKHALYHSDSECDSGGFLNADDCPNNKYNMRDWKSGLLQNVGNSDAHSAFDTTIQAPSHCGSSDVWSDRSFGDTTPYKDKFTRRLHWALE